MQNQNEFIEVIKQNEALIYKVVKVYANGHEDGQDLYQEIVYQLYKSFASFRNDAKITTWMYRVALNTSVAHLTRAKKNAPHIQLDETLLNMPGTADTVMEERSAALFAQIKQLSEIEKGIILLYLDGKPYDEIAAITGFTASNVGTRLGRIKEKLTSKIKK